AFVKMRKYLHLPEMDEPADLAGLRTLLDGAQFEFRDMVYKFRNHKHIAANGQNLMAVTIGLQPDISDILADVKALFAVLDSDDLLKNFKSIGGLPLNGRGLGFDFLTLSDTNSLQPEHYRAVLHQYCCFKQYPHPYNTGNFRGITDVQSLDNLPSDLQENKNMTSASSIVLTNG
ncbi:hypothetical protein H4R34_002896, partial [Dimargaris verticillata]